MGQRTVVVPSSDARRSSGCTTVVGEDEDAAAIEEDEAVVVTTEDAELVADAEVGAAAHLHAGHDQADRSGDLDSRQWHPQQIPWPHGIS
jgi:hypothetical protein